MKVQIAQTILIVLILACSINCEAPPVQESQAPAPNNEESSGGISSENATNIDNSCFVGCQQSGCGPNDGSCYDEAGIGFIFTPSFQQYCPEAYTQFSDANVDASTFSDKIAQCYIDIGYNFNAGTPEKVSSQCMFDCFFGNQLEIRKIEEKKDDSANLIKMGPLVIAALLLVL